MLPLEVWDLKSEICNLKSGPDLHWMVHEDDTDLGWRWQQRLEGVRAAAAGCTARLQHTPRGGSMSGSLETRTKRSYAGRAFGAPLVSQAFWSTDESHRAALEVQRAAVRGAPDVRGAVHPPTALVCWQVRGPRTARLHMINVSAVE